MVTTRSQRRILRLAYVLRRPAQYHEGMINDWPPGVRYEFRRTSTFPFVSGKGSLPGLGADVVEALSLHKAYQNKR